MPVVFRPVWVAAAIAAATAWSAVGAPAAPEDPTSLMDRSVRPGDDFYRYANGAWLRTATAPAGVGAYGLREMVAARSDQRVRELIHQAANAPDGATARKVGDDYAAFMDTDAIEGRGMSPLAGELARIAAVTDRTTLAAYLGSTLNSEVDGLVANADHLFGIWINQGFEDADHNWPHLWQGGLGLPDRETYLDPAPKAADLRGRYQAHIAEVLKLAGEADAEARAARVLAMEVKIARSHAPDADALDVAKQNNPWRRADFVGKAPGLDWDAYFAAAGLSRQADFLIWQPSAVTGGAALAGSEDLATWRDYLRLHLVDHYALVLPKAVRAEHFAFYGQALAGAAQPSAREDEAVAAVTGALPQAIGRLYVRRWYSSEAKAQAEAMASNLRAAFRARIPRLAWMSPETRCKALAKLEAFEIALAYPDHWLDDGPLLVERGDAFGNLRRAEAFTRAHNLARLKAPVDPIDWPVNPQVAGGVIMFSPNAEFFTAPLLQPPYFDPKGDLAANYGSAGAAMAHEVSHSFDELGHLYDDRGRLRDWWTAEDQARYRAAGARLKAQLDADCPLAGVCLKGEQMLGESLSDLGGLVVAYDAYHLALKGRPDRTIGGLTGDQRFFLAFAQRWRRLQTEASLRHQIATDTHPPAEYRSDAVRNLDAWYKAFRVGPGDKLYLKPEDRAGVW